MGDVLVKWRMAKIPTVVELVGELPKERCLKKGLRQKCVLLYMEMDF